MLGALVLAPALLPSTRTLAPSLVAGRRHPRPSAIVWDELSKELDATVPVYVVANQAGRPLEDESSGFLCYLDPTAAQAALETAIGLDPTLGLRLLPTGLGSALSQANVGRARLIPAAADLQAARDAYPDGEDWEGGALPLFGCQQMQRTRADGSLATPLDPGLLLTLALTLPLPRFLPVSLPLPLPLTLTLTLNPNV